MRRDPLADDEVDHEAVPTSAHDPAPNGDRPISHHGELGVLAGAQDIYCLSTTIGKHSYAFEARQQHVEKNLAR